MSIDIVAKNKSISKTITKTTDATFASFSPGRDEKKKLVLPPNHSLLDSLDQIPSPENLQSRQVEEVGWTSKDFSIIVGDLKLW